MVVTVVVVVGDVVGDPKGWWPPTLAEVCDVCTKVDVDVGLGIETDTWNP